MGTKHTTYVVLRQVLSSYANFVPIIKVCFAGKILFLIVCISTANCK